MLSLSESDRANLESGLDAIRKIELFSAEFENGDQMYENELHFDAILMNFVVIGEMVARITIETQEGTPEIPWPMIKSFRNIIAHNYFGVDAEEVWQIIEHHMPLLKESFHRLLNQE